MTGLVREKSSLSETREGGSQKGALGEGLRGCEGSGGFAAWRAFPRRSSGGNRASRSAPETRPWG